MKTTPKPLVDVLHIMPSLAGSGKVTVRLHPRRCEPEPDIYSSKLGGHFLWPAEEQWPTCDLPEDALTDDFVWAKSPEGYSVGDPVNIWSKGHPKHNNAFVGVLQLRAEDFPEVEFPEGTNLFQLLWCPRWHIGFASMLYQVYWRKVEEISRPLLVQPRPSHPDNDLDPRPCCVFPERVTEYPHVLELTEEELEALKDVNGIERSYFYQCLLSTAPGVKIGGYVDWIQNPEVPVCECASEMEHLVTIASGEFDPDSAERWCPIEDQQVWKQSMRTEYQEAKALHEKAAMAQVSPGLIIGDCGSIYLFICRRCEGWPTKTVFQCS